MIKVDIVNEVSKVADITKVKAEVAVDAVFDAMRLSMQRGERIELRGFGVFQVKPRKRGIGRNPRTGKEVRIPPGPHHPLQAWQGPPEHRRVIVAASRRAGPSRNRVSASSRSTPRSRSRSGAASFTSRLWLHVVLLVLTIASTTLVGALHYASFLEEFSSRRVAIDWTVVSRRALV